MEVGEEKDEYEKGGEAEGKDVGGGGQNKRI